MGRTSRPFLSNLDASSIVAGATMLWFVALPALGGFTVGTRLSTTTNDLLTRMEHWREVTRVLKDDALSTWLGNGIGTFPIQYHLQLTNNRYPKSFRLHQDEQTRHLEIDPGPLSLLQRVSSQVGGGYEISALVRSPVKHASLTFSVCQRNILYFGGMGCRGGRLNLTETTTWQVVSAAGVIGKVGPSTWPATLKLDAQRGPVEVRQIAVRVLEGDLLDNGDFERGLDRWFMVSDYDHLPWHTKNNFAHVLVEQDLIRLGLFVTLLSVALYRALKRMVRGSGRDIVYLGSIGGFLLVGLLGSPLDIPRVALLFFCVTTLAYCVNLVPREDPPTVERENGAEATALPDTLEDLVRLYRQGHLTHEEFGQAKKRVLNR